MEPEKKKKRKVYTQEFKLEAVRLTTEPDQSVAKIARDLGLSENTLWRWCKEFKDDPHAAFPGQGKLKPQDEELRRLRREVQVLRQERDFLKKAAVWLAREAHSSTD